MIVIALAVIAVPVVVLGGEIEVARHGTDVPTPDVATLALTIPPGLTRVLWLGDSTAAGVGASDVDGALSTQVARRLPAAGGADVSVIAVSGARIADMIRDQLPRVHKFTPDVVVISVGANDTVHLTRARRFRDAYTHVIDGLRAQGVAAAHVVMVGVPDMGAPRRLLQPLRAITGLRARRLDREVRRVAGATHAHYVDLFRATSKPFRAHPSKYFARDKYHPSDAGYALWADAIAPAVAAAVAN